MASTIFGYTFARATELLPLLAHTVEAGKNLLRMICRSCSPNTDAIWIMARPIGVVR